MIDIEARKQQLRVVHEDLATLAEATGLPSIARDIRSLRLPKLNQEQFSLVVLGEFNRGKSTFINALLGEPLLPSGITPTTATLVHLRAGPAVHVEAVFQDGTRREVDPAHLATWLTVTGLATMTPPPVGLDFLDIQHPAPLLGEARLTIVDTPGVNDIGEQGTAITYGYLPRADAALFLLDATQILTASERVFLEERILKSSRERLVFVVTKMDLLDAREQAEALGYLRSQLHALLGEVIIFPVSAKRALAGDAGSSGVGALVDHLRLTFDEGRRRLLLDHASADAEGLVHLLRQSLGMRRSALQLSFADLSERAERAQGRLHSGQRALQSVAGTIASESAAIKARVRQDLTAFTDDWLAHLPGEIDQLAAADVERYLSGFLRDTWKDWAEQESAIITTALQDLTERVIEVANEGALELERAVARDLAIADEATALPLHVDTFKYDASIFAVGALGTTLFLFVDGMVGGVLTLAAPLLALALRGRMADELKAEAKAQAPQAIRRVALQAAPRLEEIVDGFAARLRSFVEEAGVALHRAIAEVLKQAVADRQQRATESSAMPAVAEIDGRLGQCKAIEERLVDLRQALWQNP